MITPRLLLFCLMLSRRLRAALRLTGGVQFCVFGVGEEAGAGQEADAFGSLNRKAAAASFDDVYGEMGMPPVLKLRPADIKRTAGDLAEQDIA